MKRERREIVRNFQQSHFEYTHYPPIYLIQSQITTQSYNKVSEIHNSKTYGGSVDGQQEK